MLRVTAGKASPKSPVALFAYAAGATAILADLFLIAFYALLAMNLELDAILGSASDLVGSLATAFMTRWRSPWAGAYRTDAPHALCKQPG
jgi:hypothetical protein